MKQLNNSLLLPKTYNHFTSKEYIEPPKGHKKSNTYKMLLLRGPKRPYFELCICLGSNPASPTFFYYSSQYSFK